MQEVFQAIPNILEQLESDDSVLSAFVFAAWRKTAGEQLRQRTATVSFGQKRLTIAVENEMWKRHLQDLSGEMLYGLNSLLGHGTVNFIEFRVDEAAIGRANALGKAKAEPPIDQTAITSKLRKAAGTINDEGLRESFLAAAAAYLSQQKR